MRKLGDFYRVIPLFSLLTLLTVGNATGQHSPATDDLRPTMRAIFQALTTTVPLSLNQQAFRDRQHRQTVHKELRQLADNTDRLATHGQTASAYFNFLGQSLHRDARRTLEYFKSGEIEKARFTLNRLTDQCFLCHSRLPNPQRFSLGKRFIETVPLEQLSLHERVRLAVAARQFEAVLTFCETLLRSPEIPPARLDLMSLFEDYLRIAIRVQGNATRAITAFESFQRRPDIPRYLKQHLTNWVAALKALQSESTPDNSLARARNLIHTGRQRNQFLADRQGLVHFAFASSLLHRYVENSERPPLQLAEAYYLLGVTESNLSRSSWIPETEFFLEMAIRLAPDSFHAKNAYTFLEEVVTLGYTGSSGVQLPSEVKTQLDDLRRLVDAASPPK